MVEIIQELLLTNNCVILPGFGAFIGNYNPAELRLSENKIFPPSKNIAFNRTLLANDGLMVNLTSHFFSITYKEAEERVNIFAKTCNENLSLHKSLILKNIGRFNVDTEHKIQFQPFYEKNYLSESFGLKTMSLYPILRLKDIQTEIKENYQRVLHPELMQDIVTPKLKTKNLFLKVAAILAIAIITSALGLYFNKNNINTNHTSLIPVFDSSLKKQNIINEDKQTKPVSKFIENKTKTNNLLTAVNENKKSSIDEVKTLGVSKTKSYVVIGTFFDQSRADKLELEAVNSGFRTLILEDNNNALFRVTVVTENNELEASLVNIKSTLNPRAWVYCLKCDLK